MPYYRHDLSLQTLAVTKAVFGDFAARKEEFLKVVRKVQDFVEDSEVRPWLDKLLISNNKVWLTPEDFQAFMDSMERKPMLLIAGTSMATYERIIVL